MTRETHLFWQAARDALPFTIVVGAFGFLFGVVALETGLTLAQAMGFSVLVIAGAAQFTALQLMTDAAPLAIVVFAALAVNLRMAMYSAALVPYLGPAPFWQRAFAGYLLFDQSFAVSSARFEIEQMTTRERMAFFFGSAAFVAPIWVIATLAGALIGTAIPANIPIDMAMPLTFLAMIGPMLRTPAHVAAAVTSAVLATLLRGLPAGTGLLLAGVAAMAVGARVELWLARK